MHIDLTSMTYSGVTTGANVTGNYRAVFTYTISGTGGADDEMVEVWASTEVSQRTASMGTISVSCTFYTVGGAVIDTHDASTIKNRIASTLNDPVIGPLLALAEAVHEVEYINDADVSLIWRGETSKQLRDYLV